MIGFIGFGRMGYALVAGAINARVLPASTVVVSDSDSKQQQAAKSLQVKVARDASDVVRRSTFVFLCVKPQVMRGVVEEIRLHTDPRLLRKKCFVSIAAGLPIKRFETWLGRGVAVFRVMPNTPALLMTGMSALSRGRFGTSGQERQIVKILSSVGLVSRVKETQMDAITAVSGSGPAYVFYLAEALMDGAKAAGLAPALARQLVHQTLYGAGLMLAKRSEPAEELRRQVTSPGGTTAAAIAVFDKKNLKPLVRQAVLAATRRSKELSNY